MSALGRPAAGDVGQCGRCGAVAPVDLSEDRHTWLCTRCLEHSAEVPVADEDAAPPRSQPVSSEIAVPQSSVLAPCLNPAPAAEDAEAATSTAAEDVEHLLRLAEAGQLEPVPVELPPLPDHLAARTGVQAVVAFYKRVLGVRRAVCDERDVLFAGRWVAQHVDLPAASVYRVLGALTGAGVLIKTGSLEPLPGRRHGTDLYAPGVLPAAAVGVERRAGSVGDALEPEAHLSDEYFVLGAEGAAIEGLALTVGGGAVDVHGTDRRRRLGGGPRQGGDRGARRDD